MLKKSLTVLALAVVFGSATAQAAPIRIILVGDSTMAPHNGYGDALCARLKAESSCINLAKNGRSSGSFRAEGLWDHVQTLLRDGAKWSRTYVLIQFGHNDQPGKPGRSTDLATEFPANMARYAQEVKALGGVPVLVTSLTRRSFRDKVLVNDLRPWAEASLNVAAAEGIHGLDLNAESFTAVQAMGEDEADTLAVVPKPVQAPLRTQSSTDLNRLEPVGPSRSTFDRTHVGEKGARLFARMLERQFRLAIPETGQSFSGD